MTVYNFQREDVSPLKSYEKDWPHGYCTRSGEPARLIADDLKQHSYPLAWTIGTFDSRLLHSRLDGRTSEYGDKPDDIMCSAPPPLRIWVAINDRTETWASFREELAAKTYIDHQGAEGWRIFEMKEIR